MKNVKYLFEHFWQLVTIFGWLLTVLGGYLSFFGTGFGLVLQFYTQAQLVCKIIRRHFGSNQGENKAAMMMPNGTFWAVSKVA